MRRESPPRRMTAEEFKLSAQAIVGRQHGWQTKIAIKLGVHRASVSRWLSGKIPVPNPVSVALRSGSLSAKIEVEFDRSHPLSWRLPREVISLDAFDFSEAHVQSDFDPTMIGSLTHPKMAGSRVKMSPEEIRDTLRSGRISEDAKAYLLEVFKQCDGLDLKLFRHSCGGSLHQMARTMIECNVSHPFVAEWINRRSPNYQPSDEDYHRWWPDRKLSIAR